MPKINTLAARKKLAPRREPYWGEPIAKGLFLGFRALDANGNGTWVARYRVDGAQRYRALGSTELVEFEAALDEARAFKKAEDAGVRGQGIDTVADACRDYVAALRKEGRESAALDAERRFERTIYHDRIGTVALSKLRERDVESWFERVQQGKLGKLPPTKGRPPEHKPLAKATANRMRTPLVAALNRAVTRRYVAPERAIEWESVKPHKDAGARRELYLDLDQRRALLEHAGADVRDLMECIILTGCRPGDPAAVLRKDYDARHGTVTFRTKGHTRTVPLSPPAKALFDRLAKGKLPRAPMFTNAGAPWQPHDWRQPVKDAAAAAGLPDSVVLYTLRHGWITDAIVGGMDLLTVAKLAGTSLAMIEKHYGHLVHGAAREKLAAVQML
ncbi:tyrosine-type recombinase/integrase [[Pseudomonas] boreopolis]|uniref:tyrosine-type recombinase/integrase n=1 Tax=Xanthomonas boreopolis TaxID=86183 RepID=UPI003D402D19